MKAPWLIQLVRIFRLLVLIPALGFTLFATVASLEPAAGFPIQLGWFIGWLTASIGLCGVIGTDACRLVAGFRRG